MEVKKAVIPIAGLGKRFRPLSNVLPKELWPLVDKPVLEYIIEEALSSGVKQLIFVNRPGKKILTDYLKSYSFPQIIQKKPLGDGDAILKAKKIIGREFFAVLFGDDVVESKVPCILQLIKVFKKRKKPIIALQPVAKEKVSSYGIVKVKKIDNSLYQILDIVEKPKSREAPSNLAIVGKYILTPDIFDYLKKIKPRRDKEVRLADGLIEMLKAGKTILGLKIEGKWLECGNKQAYLKSNLYLSLKHPQFGKELRKNLKEV